jgi:outer membrane protein assembly factor BamD (BamD/ComL family)
MKYVVSSFSVLLILSVLIAACGFGKSEEELHTELLQLEKEGDVSKTLEVLNELLDNYPKGKYTPEVLQKTAFVYYNDKQDYARAIELHLQLIEEFPDSEYVPQARFMIGFMYANELQDYEMARHYYNDFIQHHPDHELNDSVRWELEHLGQDVNEQMSDLLEIPETNGSSK